MKLRWYRPRVLPRVKPRVPRLRVGPVSVSHKCRVNANLPAGFVIVVRKGRR